MTPNSVVGAVLYAVIGLLLFLAALRSIAALLPGDAWRKATQENSIAAAIVIAGLALGSAWIVAAAVH